MTQQRADPQNDDWIVNQCSKCTCSILYFFELEIDVDEDTNHGDYAR